MQIAYISAAGRGCTDLVVARTVDRLEARGLALAGTVATDLDRLAGEDCGMKLHLLPARRPAAVSQALGRGSRGCRLDPGSVEDLAQATFAALGRAQALVVNKFGKVEAAGRGFVPVIAAALDRGMPVLVGVNALNLPDFLEFAGDLATALPDSPALAADWMLHALRRAA